jgi:Leucine-rich repeat (LRR) protein
MINLFFKVNLTNNHEPATSMLKRTATVLLALMTSATTWAVDNKAGILGDGEDIHAVAINETNFPDFNFRENWVLKQAFAADNYLTDQEAASVTAIDVSSKGIADLTGIEYFTALISLNCSDNLLTALDLSKNTALEVLDCSNNYLTALDVSKNTALKELYCYRNWIRDEDMLALVNSLHQNGGTLCAYATTNDQNEMTTPRVADAKAKNWQVKAWDGSKYVDYAGIFAVDVNEKNFPDAAFRNYVSTLDANPTNGYLDEGEIDFTKRIEVSSMNITSLKGIEHFPALLYLKCDGNQLADLDLSKNTALIELDCSNNKLTAIDVSNNTALTILDCYDNQLTALDVSANTALEYLNCSNNKLTALDMTHNTSLEQLDCSGNKISKGMQALVSSLPQNDGKLYAYNSAANDGNRITTEQVDAADEKGWLVYAGSGDDWYMYLGILLGDANGDEYVDVADIVAVVSHQKGQDVEGFCLSAADVNDDGKADGKDAELISKMIMEEREENQ